MKTDRKRSFCIAFIIAFTVSALLTGCAGPTHGSDITDTSASAEKRAPPQVLTACGSGENSASEISAEVYDAVYTYREYFDDEMYELSEYVFQNSSYRLTPVAAERSAYRKTDRWTYAGKEGKYTWGRNADIVIDKSTGKAVYFELDEKTWGDFYVSYPVALMMFCTFMSEEYPELDFSEYDMQISEGEEEHIAFSFYGKSRKNGVLTSVFEATVNNRGTVIYLNIDNYCEPDGVPDFTAEEYLDAAEAKLGRLYGDRGNGETVSDIRLSEELRGGYLSERGQYGVIFGATYTVTDANGATRERSTDFISPYGEAGGNPTAAFIDSIYYSLPENKHKNAAGSFDIDYPKILAEDYRTEFYGDSETVEYGVSSAELYYQYNYLSREGLDYIKYANIRGVNGSFNVGTGCFDSLNNLYCYTDEVDMDTALGRATEIVKAINPTIDFDAMEFDCIPENGNNPKYLLKGKTLRNGLSICSLSITADECGNLLAYEYIPFVGTEKIYGVTEADIFAACSQRLEKLFGVSGIPQEALTNIYLRGCVYIASENAYALECYLEWDFSDMTDSEGNAIGIVSGDFAVVYDYAQEAE